MTRIDEIRQRRDKARPGLAEIDGGEEILKRRGNPKGVYTWTLYGAYADAILLVNAPADIAWLLDALARRDQRCEDLAVQLDAIRALHKPFEWSFGEGPVQSCAECARLGASEEEASYPCPTIRALNDIEEN